MCGSGNSLGSVEVRQVYTGQNDATPIFILVSLTSIISSQPDQLLIFAGMSKRGVPEIACSDSAGHMVAFLLNGGLNCCSVVKTQK